MEDKEIEFSKKLEVEVNPRSIAIVTTTFYPRWYPGESEEQNAIDKIRGDLAIQTIEEAKQKEYQIVVVDGGSSELFKAKLARMGIRVLPQFEPGMSRSRQQAFMEASKIEGIKVICWAEPEKVSLIRDCLPKAILPILNNEADIVIPKRSAASLNTYPDYQVAYEKRANHLWNNILRARGFLAGDSEDLDVFFGPKFFVNKPDLVKLFLNEYEFIKGRIALHSNVNPEFWANATFLPIVTALHNQFRVVSVEVPYSHPPQQTVLETESPQFVRKRDIQRKDIIVNTIHLIRLLENSPRKKSRLKRS